MADFQVFARKVYPEAIVRLAAYKKYFGPAKTAKDLEAISFSEWSHIVRKVYWDVCHGDDIRNQSIAEIFVDWFICSGISGVRALQRAQGLRVDGIIGARMLRMLNQPDELVIFNRIKSARESYCRKLCLIDPGNYKYLDDWLARLNNFIFCKS